MKNFVIVSVNVSEQKGTAKKPVASITLQKDFGIIGDAHGGAKTRQVSLLAEEDLLAFSDQGVSCGDFAENITTRGIDLAALPIGARLTIGKAKLEISQIGKQCHGLCAVGKK
ncbi:MAG: hypothetical protein PHC61_17530, partial [Chitinivibrionales bacterium]|nr:hypothetical protein [Chitinivibrionales bacterium]